MFFLLFKCVTNQVLINSNHYLSFINIFVFLEKFIKFLKKKKKAIFKKP
jgi:hypothetical protein